VLVRAVVIATLAAGLFALPAHAQIGERTLLMPGVTYDREVEFTPHGPVVLHVITAPRPDGSLYRLTPYLSNNAMVATDKLTAIEQSLTAQATVAGVNGDYFDPNPGDPKGILIREGVLDGPPADKRSSLGIGVDGSLQVARVAFNGIWKGTGQRRALTLNQPTGPAVLYTSAWGPATPPESSAVVAAVIPSLGPTKPNVDLTGNVAQLVTTGNVPIPPNGAVLVARGTQAPILAREAPPATDLFLRMVLTPDWSGMTGAIGGGPVLVRNGTPVFRADEDIAASLLNPRSSRTAVGQLKDGRIVLVTADGALPGYSVGMTSFELALALVRLGAVQAMALGSGPSSAMAFDGTLLSRAAREEGQIADALLLQYTGVYVPAPATSTLSPNGDGVDDTLELSYKLVRPSRVTASVSGGSVTQVLDSGDRDPGLHTFTFTGKRADGSPLPEGAYKLTVDALDDRGQASRAERTFALNQTLAGLTATPTSVRLSASNRRALTVGFTLSRPADVRVTIERSGIVIRTLVAKQLAAGPQQIVWDGRNAAGRVAIGGPYAVRIRASNSIGRVELVQPFTARRG
jgi:flagellar hook assembly protein FlgD